MAAGGTRRVSFNFLGPLFLSLGWMIIGALQSRWLTCPVECCSPMVLCLLYPTLNMWFALSEAG